MARILANGQTEFIGIIIQNLFLHYYSEMLDKILYTYEQFGYKFLVFIGNEKEETERRYIRELLAYKIEGLIVLSHTIPSEELASLGIPIVTIEREDRQVCSVNTDNYMGGCQAAGLLARHRCDVLIHINSSGDKNVPAYGRIRGFLDICEETKLPHELFIEQMGNSHESLKERLADILYGLEQKYAGRKKGIFLSNDTQANVFLNLLVRKYGFLPEDYLIIGFDNSPISREALMPIRTIGQQIDKIAKEAVSRLVAQRNECNKRRPIPLKEPVHKVITPILLKRETTERT